MTHSSINYTFKGVLVVAIALLFILQLRKDKVHNNIEKVGDEAVSRLAIAYINVDSLLLNYYLAIDLRNQIVVKEENARAIMTKRLREVETDMLKYKQNLEANPFIPREQSDLEYQRVIDKQKEIYRLNRLLSEELREEQDRLYMQLYNNIILQLKEFNEIKKYKIVFSNTGTDNILYALDCYNITHNVINYLNRDFTAPSLLENK
jgi:Outer membrane protein (OmpH-like).